MTENVTQFQLDHLYLTAKKPEWLADWYAKTFGFQAKDGFVVGGGVVLVFEAGDPIPHPTRPQFGFRCDSPDAVTKLAGTLEAALEEEEVYCGFQALDPEGYRFEVYWEATV